MYKGSVIARLVAGLAVLLSCTLLQAQQWTPSAIATESGVDIIPDVSAELRYDDNIANSHAATKGSWISVLTPTVKAQLTDGASLYSLTAQLVHGHYFSSTDDNYLDAAVSALAKIDLHHSHRLNFSSRFSSGHEARGTGITEGIGNQLPEPIDVNTFDISGYYEYGAMSAAGRIRLQAGYFDKKYQNYEQLTMFRNYDNQKLGAVFYYSTGAFTRLLAEVSRDDTRYDVTDLTGSRDSTTMNYRLGLEWQPSTLTSAELRAGYQTKDFDDARRQDFSGLAWQLTFNWAPLSYSGFEVTTGRKSKDPNTAGDYVRETHYSVNWRHHWTPLFITRTGFSQTDERYTGIERDDKLKSFNIRGFYSLRQNILLNAGVSVSRHSSTVTTMQFDKNVFYFGLQLAL
ncbi:outer membrane beta-barrel protein [Chromatiaceae bacterium AAb-1]|nr:outer membrane beta-barrel protein [Chromatiaceae bacterium AAb-1]